MQCPHDGSNAGAHDGVVLIARRRGKGQLEFVAAADALRTRCPEARFAIVGAGTMEALLRARIDELGLGERVTMVPFTRDVPAIMNALDVLVHPALGTEAAPLVIWEALAAGRPVIASRLDGIPETFREGEHGVLVPPGDVAALAEAIDRLAHGAELRARLGAAGREHALREHSREAQAARVLALYRRLVADAPGGARA
jgi:glycosyltransferase involved in cell wall biosynthesis